MFRILITNSSGKHAIALARYLKRAFPEAHLISHCTTRFDVARWYRCFDEYISGVPLEATLCGRGFDMVIPVGRDAVGPAAAICPDLAVLPSRENLEVCYDKARTVAFAEEIGVPAPRTQFLRAVKDLDAGTVSFPCVVKPSREDVAYKKVCYCTTIEAVARKADEMLDAVRGEGAGVLVQEYINGTGCGFFALMDRGRPLRVFMHQRIREYPVSGGPSTAARAFRSERLKELGTRLLSGLHWSGVAMAEFKRESRTGEFVLMEINGKFWGSLELALRAGVDFGSDLVRLYRGEPLAYSDSYDSECHFYWPLDDDLLALWKSRSLPRIRDYWQANASTNLGQSFRADLWKLTRLAKRLFTE